MSFFFRKATNTSPNPVTHQSETERLRGRQLASLIRIGAHAVTHDQSMFDVTLSLPDNRTIFIRITLPDRFPVEPPVVQLTSLAQHPWLDQSMRVIGHNDLNNWSAHSDLGRIVSEIMNEFARNPPKVGNVHASQRMPNHSYPQTQPNNLMMNQMHKTRVSSSSLGRDEHKENNINNNNNSSNSLEERHHTQTPAIPSVFPELEELSTSQLKRLASDPIALTEYVNKMQCVQNLKSLHQELVQGNYDLASKNLKHEKSISERQNQISQQNQTLTEARQRLAIKQSQQQDILDSYDPKAMVQSVSAAADEADSYSEELASKFTKGEMMISSFIQEYIQWRTLYHLRKTKLARFTSQ